MKKSFTFALWGFAFGLGAPLGALWMLWIGAGFDQAFYDFFRTQWILNHFFYSYMLVGTCSVFSAFGSILGSYADKLHSKNLILLAQTQTDPLTGLGNHRYLHEAFHHQYQNRKSDSEPLSCLMMDLDFFKKVNDSYGHPFGDKVLKSFAESVKMTLRPGDVAVRYGGEEFVCLLPNCGQEEAVKVAERIREAVEKARFFSKNHR